MRIQRQLAIWPWCIGLTIALAVWVASAVVASGPAWWTDRGVLDPNSTPNDYAPVNQGQVKNMATNAYAEMQANLPSGAGSNVTALINSFTSENNYLPVNVGQLKNVAKPFYDRLTEIEFTNAYPWTATTADDNDYAMANIGQLKNLFNWNLTYDTIGDGIPNWWRAHYFGNGSTTNNSSCASCNPAGDGITNLYAYQHGLNPTNADTTAVSFVVTYPSDGTTIYP